MLLLHMGPHSNAQLDSSGVGLNGTAMLAVGGAAECNMLQPHAEHAWLNARAAVLGSATAVAATCQLFCCAGAVVTAALHQKGDI